MKKLLLAAFFLLASMLIVRSFHIVGGELEFITVQPGIYQINLIQYKDEAQQENRGYDPNAVVYVFSNSDNSLVYQTSLDLVSVVDVEYTNVECSIDELQTSRVLYSNTVSLNPEEFDDPLGYYIAWERCCRNGRIANIINPTGTGMKYVLEIPPLWKNNRPFINSSPVLNRPLSDYACVNQLYYVDFVGQDLDGDSLVYKLVNPLNSSSSDALPTPQPKPHIEVRWAQNFGLENIVPGTSPLKISSKGFLTVNPSNTGVYVFSVLVEEWRDKTKIGEVQRDFQMLVVDGCNPPDPPIVAVQIPDDEFFNSEVDTLKYSLTDDKCFDFIITNITQGETINLRAIPVNFVDDEGRVENVFSITSTLVGANQDSIIVEVCAPGCPPTRDAPFILDLVAGDNACPLPQLDTARLIIQIEPPPNVDPNLAPIASTHVVNENEIYTIPVLGTDLDLDRIIPFFEVRGYDNPQDLGFEFVINEDVEGRLAADLIWDTSCGTADFSTDQNFAITIGVEDVDECLFENLQTEEFLMTVILPPNTSPVISTSLSESTTNVTLGDSKAFQIDVVDGDNDPLSLKMQGIGFDPASYGIVFSTNEGNGQADGFFSWSTNCDSLPILEKDEFELLFIAEDIDACQELNADTLAVTIKIDVPANSAPTFGDFETYTLEVNVPFELDIETVDMDGVDSVTVRFFDGFRKPQSNSLSFPPVTGFSRASSTLTWTPECDLLDLDETSKTFELIFQTFDDRCPVQGSETKSIIFEVIETREYYDRFKPANAFSPNGDGINDFYSMANLPRLEQNLPPDNCDDAFLGINIHDRSGATVFESNNREFIWRGDNVAAGVYYYSIRYTQTEYKGFIQVLK